MTRGKPRNYICEVCSKEFVAHRSDKRYCGHNCMRNSVQNKKYLANFARNSGGKWAAIKHKASKFNVPLTLTLEECKILWLKPCEYCGKEINSTGVSLDRLDNSGGYTKDNVVPCCGPCNKIKNIYLTHDEMKAAMEAVLKLRGNQ